MDWADREAKHFDGTVSFTTRVGVPYYVVEMKPGDPIGYVIHTMFGSNSEEALWRKVQELSTALENAGKDAWQPMESAPKDGTGLLGWISSWDAHVVMFWRGDSWATPMKSTGFVIIPQPSHWMPLPTPPTIGEGLL